MNFYDNEERKLTFPLASTALYLSFYLLQILTLSLLDFCSKPESSKIVDSLINILLPRRALVLTFVLLGTVECCVFLSN